MRHDVMDSGECFWKPLRRILAGAALAAMVGGPLQAAAATATYEWVPTSGTGGSGTLVFDDPAITDPANFSGLDIGAVSSLMFTFTTLGESVTWAQVVSAAVSPPGFSAQNGFLTSVFLFSTNQANPLFQLTFQGVPYPNTASTAVLWVPAGLEQNFGYWQLGAGGPGPSLIPEASSAAMWIAALGFLGMLRGRTRARAAA